MARLHHMFCKYTVSSRKIAMATESLCSVNSWQSVVTLGVSVLE